MGRCLAHTDHSCHGSTEYSRSCFRAAGSWIHNRGLGRSNTDGRGCRNDESRVAYMAVFWIDPIPVEDRKKKIERDDDSKKTHRALARCGGDETAIAPSPRRHSGHPLERAIERR